MVTLGMLWQPILLAAVVAFVAGAILWMVLPHHQGDFQRLPGEADVMEALRKSNTGPGQYMLPYLTPQQRNDAAAMAAAAAGPAGMLVLRKPAPPGMGKQLAQQFVYHLAVSFVVAYLAMHSLSGGAEYLSVFRIVGTAAVLAYVAGVVPSAIWFGRPWSVVLHDAIDGVVWGLLTAGVFGWLWPR